MSCTQRFILLGIFILTVIACGLIPQSIHATVTAAAASNTPVFTATIVPTNTAIATDTPKPSNTPSPSETSVPLTTTFNAIIALQTQMVGTLVVQFGPAMHLSGFLMFYSNPVGTPLESWHDIPIMNQSTTGQEFQSDIYSYKTAATLGQATDFYNKSAASLNWSCFPPTSGSAGTGDQATHQTTFICGPLNIVIASFDNDPNQVLVVINKAL